MIWPRGKTDLAEKDIAKGIRDSVKKKFKEKAEKIFVSSSEEAIQDIKEMYNLLKKLESLIIEFDNRFLTKKKEKNILDFSDVEHMALQILVAENAEGKHVRTDVAKKYMQRFEEIAIDEYQDSNLVQEYILNAVSRGNNIFMVGDVKQSIYRFRQARPELFLEKYKTYSLENANEKGLKIQLYKNFRSRESILDFTNTIFKNIMSEDLGEIDYTEDEYLNLGATWNENNIKNEINIIDLAKVEENKNLEDEEVQNEEEQENIEDIEIEAKFVANKIKELIDSKFQVYDLKEKKNRNITYKDIVLLMRSTKGKAPIFEKELMEKNIPVYSDMSAEYIDSMEIQTILSLLKVIDNPMQDIPLVTVMRSSIGKFTDNELVEIRLIDRQCDFYTALLKSKTSVNDELREKIERFLEQIECWREEQEYLSLDELIWKIYEDTGFLSYMGVLPNGALRQENLKMLYERAKQYESASFKGLFNFIKFIERLSLSSGDLSAAKMIGENENVVRIMSIHKSKGLEFPVVFLVSASSKFNLMDLNKDILLDQELGLGVKYIDYEMQLKYDTLTKLALKNKGLIASLSEEMRILYVALTRAKEKLYIIGKINNFNEQKEKIENLIQIYNNHENRLNPILIKKYKSYLEWILLVYFNDNKNMKDLIDINIYKKEELLKTFKPEEKQQIDLIKMIEDNCKDIEDDEVEKLKKELEFEYMYKEETTIPSKTSITAIAHKDMKEIKNYTIHEEDYLQPIQTEEYEKKEFPIPKFLANEEEERIDASKRGTIVHLCMKNLDFSKKYELQDIKDLIKSLMDKEILTKKEADSIKPYQILKFTQSDIWQELMNAKEYYKEEPFYINISANEFENIECNENILAQGIIDLYYITADDKLVLLDYKTDFVNDGEESVLVERHKPQLMLYKRALEEGLNRKVDKIYIYSTVLGKSIEIRD